jgi:hypothetical protein
VIRILIAIVLSAVSLFAAGTPQSFSSTKKPVHVRQYKRKNGTPVRAHNRSSPGTANRTTKRTPAKVAPGTASRTTPK